MLIGAVATRNAVSESRLSGSLAHESDHVVFWDGPRPDLWPACGTRDFAFVVLPN